MEELLLLAVIWLLKQLYLLVRGAFRLLVRGARALVALSEGRSTASPKRTPPARADNVRPLPAPAPSLPVQPVRGRVEMPAEGIRALSLEDAVRALATRAEDLATAFRHEPANRRFLPALTQWVPAQLPRLSVAVASPERRVRQEAARELLTLERVLEEVSSLAEQRRDAALRAQLGDADTLAEACYGPVATFARAEGLPLSSVTPACQLGPFQLATWTGFAPTSIAPLFLPEDFFSRVVWWPALGHEIGHDFLVSVEGLEEGLRAELGLPSYAAGARPLDFAQGVTAEDVQRVLGAWAEELFCDVFGTLMCGPAYVATMGEVFAAKEDPREVLAVAVDEDTGLYECHPPGHLRHLVGCAVLERAGFHADAKRLAQRWAERNGFARLFPADGEADRSLFLLFPYRDGYVRFALAPWAEAALALVERLYAGKLACLNGHGLQDVAGLDYGPHEHAEAERARAALRKGRVPRVRDARAVIAGAVMAWLERPEDEAAYLALARAAIPALGTMEARPDAYSLPREAAAGGGLVTAESLREALVWREVLQPPRAAGRRVAGRSR